MSQALSVAVLVSGRGSNMAALAQAAAAPDFPARVSLVISNRPDAKALDFAAANGIPSRVIDHRRYGDRAGFDRALDDALQAADVDLVCLAGFMRLLTEGFVARWHDRLINIHPSLLPAFKGLDTHARVLAAGVRFTGCTVHFVRPAMDDGPIIVQAAVPVLPSDDADSLAARVLAQEHICYPQAVRWIAEGRVTVADGRVRVAGAGAPAGSLCNPDPWA